VVGRHDVEERDGPGSTPRAHDRAGAAVNVLWTALWRPAPAGGGSGGVRFGLGRFVQIEGSTAGLQARVVERVRAFPGMRANPTVALDRAALQGIRANREPRLWAHGTPETVGLALKRAGVQAGGLVVDSRRVLDATSLLAVSRMGLSRAARLVYLRLDALPTVPPVLLLRAPVLALAGAGLAVLVVTWLGALVAQRSADRTNLAEVLRLAE
jgi:hypothetical protein